MGPNHVDHLKKCVYLQQQLNYIDQKLTWLHTHHTGWKKYWKQFFLSKWNSQYVLSAVAGALFLTGAIMEKTVSAQPAVSIMLIAMLCVPMFVMLPLERTRLLGPSARWGWKQDTCEIHILEGMMGVFVQRHGPLAQPLWEQFVQLKNNGLSTQQAAMIARTLKHQFDISQSDALAYLSAQTTVEQQTPETHSRSNLLLLRL